MYKPGAFVITECGVLPTFISIVESILTETSDCFFVCKTYETVKFHNHYHAYEVEPHENSMVAIKQSMLVDFHTLTGHPILSNASLFI